MEEPSLPNAFVFIGHGGEAIIDIKKRNKLPDGYTLVTFTQCGIPNTFTKITKVLEKMKEDPDLFRSLGKGPSDEIKAEIEEKLGETINIYRAGDEYPSLSYTSLATIDSPDKALTLYLKSGVYKLPIELKEMPGWKITDTAVRYKPSNARCALPADFTFAKYGVMKTGKDEKTARLSYEKADFPDQKTIDGILDGSVADDFPIERVFKELKEGIYYWPICRGDVSCEPDDVQALAEKVRSVSAPRQRTQTGGKKHRGKRKTYRKKRRY